MVQRLIDADLPEGEEDRLVEDLQTSILHPYVTNLIYYHYPKLTAEEVVDKALTYRAIEL